MISDEYIPKKLQVLMEDHLTDLLNLKRNDQYINSCRYLFVYLK